MQSKAPEEYVKMLSGNSAYLSMDAILKEDIRKSKKDDDIDVKEEEIEKWKSQVRNIDKR